MSVRGLRNIEANRVDSPRPATVRMLADALDLTAADRATFVHAASRADASPVHPVPAQLPADVPGFVGRTDQIRRLAELLDHAGIDHADIDHADLDHTVEAPPAAVVVTAIAGT